MNIDSSDFEMLAMYVIGPPFDHRMPGQHRTAQAQLWVQLDHFSLSPLTEDYERRGDLFHRVEPGGLQGPACQTRLDPSMKGVPIASSIRTKTMYAVIGSEQSQMPKP